MQINSLSEVIAEGKSLATQGKVSTVIARDRQRLDTWPGWLDGYHLFAKLLIDQEALPEAIAV